MVSSAVHTLIRWEMVTCMHWSLAFAGLLTSTKYFVPV